MQIDVSDAEFGKKVLKKSEEIPVVVDFWAPWCSPCLLLSPVLERLAEENEGKFVLAKIDVSDNKENATKYGVLGIPAVKMFKNGEVVAEFTGALPENEVKQWLEENLGK